MAGGSTRHESGCGQGHEVELIVLQEHGGPAAAGLHLLGHRVGDALVHGGVPGLEGVHEDAVDVRGVGQVPQVVLDEPEQGVGDDAVVLPLRLGIELDHARPQGAPLVDGEGAAPVLPAHGHVLLGEGGAHPDGVVELRGETGEGGDEAAAAPGGGPRPVGPALELDRAPVRHDDDGAGRGRHRDVVPGRSSVDDDRTCTACKDA
jgi:hypothetical protein